MLYYYYRPGLETCGDLVVVNAVHEQTLCAAAKYTTKYKLSELCQVCVSGRGQPS